MDGGIADPVPVPRAFSPSEPICISRAIKIKDLARTPPELRRVSLRCAAYSVVGLTGIALLRPWLLGFPYTVWNVLLAPAVGVGATAVLAMLARAQVIYTTRTLRLSDRGVAIGGVIVKPEHLRSVALRGLGPTGLLLDVRYTRRGMRRRASFCCAERTDLERLVPIVEWLAARAGDAALTRTRAGRAAAG